MQVLNLLNSAILHLFLRIFIGFLLMNYELNLKYLQEGANGGT